MKTLLPTLALLVCLAPALAKDSTEPPKTKRDPAELLPAKSLFYFHFDGMNAHRAAWDKTVLAGLLKNEFGDFFQELRKLSKKLMNAEVEEITDALPVLENLEAKEKIAKKLDEVEGKDKRNSEKLEKCFDYLCAKGLAVGVDVGKIHGDNKDFQITVVFPNGGTEKNWEKVHGLLKLIPVEGGAPEETEQRGRTIILSKTQVHSGGDSETQALPIDPNAPGHFQDFEIQLQIHPGDNSEVQVLPVDPSWGNRIEPTRRTIPAEIVPFTSFAWGLHDADQETPGETHYLAWWKEGDHVVCIYGTRPPSDTLDVIDGKKPNLTSNPLYQKVAKFDQYENCCRGFVDAKQLVDLVVNASDNENSLSRGLETMFRKVLAGQLGLTGVDSLTFHSGFEGKYQRTTIKLNIAEPEQRQGLLKLISAPIEFTAKDLPPLPDDADWVSVHHVDWLRIFDTFNSMYKTVQTTQALAAGNFFPKVEGLEKPMQDALGMELRQELLAALDSTVVLSSAYSEGPWLLGNAIAIKVKDAAKLQAALNNLADLLKKAFKDAGEVQIKKTNYCGGTITTLRLPVDPIGISPSFTIHNGWLVLGAFPQNVKSHLWRCKNPGAAWKIPAAAEQAIQAGLKNGTAKTKLAALTVNDPRRTLEVLMPFAPLAAQMIPFVDVATLPPTKAVTSKLSPNVTAFFEDGNAWRWECYSTVEIPSLTELTLLYGLFGLAADRDFSIPFVQTWRPEQGLTLPSPNYLKHPPQFIPETPVFPFPKESDSLDKAIAAQSESAGNRFLPNGCLPPSPPVGTPFSHIFFGRSEAPQTATPLTIPKPSFVQPSSTPAARQR